jgi:tetratricopeptide (TPR) repeat protein
VFQEKNQMWVRTGIVLSAIGLMSIPLQARAQDATEQRTPDMTRHLVVAAGRLQQAQSEVEDSVRLAAYRAALEVVYEAIEDDPGNPAVYLHLGWARIGLHEYAAADSAFDKAEEIYPEYFDEDDGTGPFREDGWIDAYNDAVNRGEAGDREGAVMFFRLANGLYDLRPEAYLNLGTHLYNLGDSDGSIEAWEGALRVIGSPDSRPPDDEARELWEGQYWVTAQTNLAQLYGSLGRADEMVRVYEEMLERDPNNTRLQGELAMAMAQSGQGEGALSVYDAILETDDGSALDYFNAGITLYQAESFEKAAIAFEKVITRAPMFRDALQNLAETLRLTGRLEDQIPHSARLLEIDPNNERALQMHVRALAQLERQDEAREYLTRLQDLPFIVDNLQLQPRSDGGRVVGVVVNNTLTVGESVTLRFTFYDAEGTPLGTADAEVPLSDPDVAMQFDVSFDAETIVLGYSYEVMR